MNVINVFNPLAWIMGLVWYLPLFFVVYPRASRWGRLLLLLPLFVPPFLNANAALAYVIALVFLLTARLPRLGIHLLASDADCAVGQESLI